MVYLYMLKSRFDGSYYVGITEDIGDRLKKHNSGGIPSTAQKRPWTVIYSKTYPDYETARKHEKWLKKKNHEYKDKLAGLKSSRLQEAGQVRAPIGLPRPTKLAGREKQKVVVKRKGKSIIINDWPLRQVHGKKK